MKNTKVIKTLTAVAGALLFAGCATSGSGDMSLAQEYERSIPVCVGTADCQAKMATARKWIKSTTDLQITTDTGDVLETAGYGMHTYTALRVELAPIGSDSYWVLVELDCASTSAGVALDHRPCPPYWETMVDFNHVVDATTR